jgi:hypothetical protein
MYECVLFVQAVMPAYIQEMLHPQADLVLVLWYAALRALY